MISSLLEHARRYHPDTEIVSKTCEQTIVRSNYRTLSHRAKQMAQSLIAMGVKPGDRVVASHPDQIKDKQRLTENSIQELK